MCAGPGGFSEYVLFRKKWEAKGFGFTLKGSHDFKLEDFFAGPPESFEPHYGKIFSFLMVLLYSKKFIKYVMLYIMLNVIRDKL